MFNNNSSSHNGCGLWCKNVRPHVVSLSVPVFNFLRRHVTGSQLLLLHLCLCVNGFEMSL